MTEDRASREFLAFVDGCVAQGRLDPEMAARLVQLRATTPPLEEPYAPVLVAAPPARELTFDTYVPCKANEFPLEVARVVAEEAGRRSVYSPLYVYGSIGLGKTHLLSAIANQATGRVVMANAADLEAELEHATKLGARARFRQWLSGADILLVDDIQLCEGRIDLQHELFAVINLMVRDGHGVVFASDVPPTRLRGVEERLLSRLGSGVIVGLQLGDKQARLEILKRFTQQHPLSADVLLYLAEHVTDNVRRLKGAATQLIATQERTGAPVDLRLARAVVPLEADLEPSSPMKEALTQPRGAADRFKEMLAGAETEAEQVLALQIAVGERLRHLRSTGGEADAIQRLEKALTALRAGQLKEALEHIR